MEQKTLFVKPTNRCLKVIHPFQRRYVKEDGEEIQECSWLARRLKDGDMCIADRPNKVEQAVKAEESVDSTKPGKDSPKKKFKGHQPKKKAFDAE